MSNSLLKHLQALRPDTVATLPAQGGLAQSFHRWSQAEIDSLQIAWAARRPLLVRGEPGIGKTQLARAAAVAVGARLHALTVNARTEPEDLLYRFDAIKRLADAQAQRPLDESAYWEPGPLWCAFNWAEAVKYGSLKGCKEQPAAHVILLDEIDKADSDLPNSLLELLGQRHQAIPALGIALGGAGAQPPLTVITSNEERELPAAFLRRCMVLNLQPPEAEGKSYTQWLVERGKAHFSGSAGSPKLAAKVLQAAAEQLADDRQEAQALGQHRPGAAEYIDLLHALAELAPRDASRQLLMLDRLSAFAFVKHAAVDGAAGPGQARPPRSRGDASAAPLSD